MYCENCKQVVQEHRIIGVGTLIAAIVTGGLWLIAIMMYNKRCPICHDTRFRLRENDNE